MEILIIFAIAWAFKGAWDHTKAAYQRSRDDRLAEVARTYPGGVIPEPQRAAIARHHALGYWGGEILHGFPVARTGLHAGWIAHKTAAARAKAIREDAHTAHEDAAESFRQRVEARRDATRQALAESEEVFADPAADVPDDGGADAARAAAGIAAGRKDPRCIFCGTDLAARPNDGLAHRDCAQAEADDGSRDPDVPPAVEPGAASVWDTSFHDGDPDGPRQAAGGPAIAATDPPAAYAAQGDDTTNPNGETHMEDTMIRNGPETAGGDMGGNVDGDAGTDLASTKGASGALKGLASSLTEQIDGIIGNLLSKNADPNVIAHFEQMQEQAAELSGLADQSGALLGGVHTDIADAHAAAGGEAHVADTPWYSEA